MLEFLRRLFAPEPRSSETAKERLRLVLLSDHLSLAPDVVEALKRDLLDVISRYLEIDPSLADVTFEQRESEVAMLASIPIVGVRERTAATAAARPVALPFPEPPLSEAKLPGSAAAEPEGAATSEPAASIVGNAPASSEPDAGYAGDEPQASIARSEPAENAPREPEAPRTPSSAARRRRRKKAAALANRLQQSTATTGYKPA